MRAVGAIKNGAVAIRAGRIVAVGETNAIRNLHQAAREVDATGQTICPGFVDPHTHVVFAGHRANEFELKLRGAGYLDILAAGGGILSTVQATRAATPEQLVCESRERLRQMLRLGTTTAECKTGYGLETVTELKQLQALQILAETQPIELVPTFLGAHTVPPEFKGRADQYVDLVIEEMIPATLRNPNPSARQTAPRMGIPKFVDVFCEQNAFSVTQAQRVLAAGQRAGMQVKAHVDQFNSLGGVQMALALGAVSVDHLEVTTDEDIARIAQSNTVAVLIPAASFNLGQGHYANGRGLIDAGAIVALCTDINPGSAPCPSLPLVMAIACRYMKLSPAEALNACTINAAHAIQLGDRIGSIEVGKQADLLILAAPDYRHLAYQFGGNLIQTVIKRGELVE